MLGRILFRGNRRIGNFGSRETRSGQGLVELFHPADRLLDIRRPWVDFTLSHRGFPPSVRSSPSGGRRSRDRRSRSWKKKGARPLRTPPSAKAPSPRVPFCLIVDGHNGGNGVLRVGERLR